MAPVGGKDKAGKKAQPDFIGKAPRVASGDNADLLTLTERQLLAEYDKLGGYFLGLTKEEKRDNEKLVLRMEAIRARLLTAGKHTPPLPKEKWRLPRSPWFWLAVALVAGLVAFGFSLGSATIYFRES